MTALIESMVTAVKTFAIAGPADAVWAVLYRELAAVGLPGYPVNDPGRWKLVSQREDRVCLTGQVYDMLTLTPLSVWMALGVAGGADEPDAAWSLVFEVHLPTKPDHEGEVLARSVLLNFPDPLFPDRPRLAEQKFGRNGLRVDIARARECLNLEQFAKNFATLLLSEMSA